MTRREALVDHHGDVTVESYAVMYEGDAPAVAHAACLLPDGRRTWANVVDADAAAEMAAEEFCGRAGSVDGEGTLELRG